MSKSKARGTLAESAVRAAARRNGFPEADRRVMYGSADKGDILLCSNPDIIIEVKGGDAAKSASDNLIEEWLDETETERINAGAEFGFLAVQRRGVGPKNAEHWWAYTRANPMQNPHWGLGLRLGFGETDGYQVFSPIQIPVRMLLVDMLRTLRWDINERNAK